MSWVTVIWSAASGACLMLAAIHFLIWCRDRRSWANLCFTVMVLGVIGIGILELVMLRTHSTEVFGLVCRWAHLSFGFCVAGSLGFVHFYFGTGRTGLLAAALGLRLLAVVANFMTGANLHFESVQSLQYVSFLGEPVAVVGEWVANPWVRLGQLASLVQIVYLVDASVRLWRVGSPDARRRAACVGGSLVFFILVVVGHSGLVAAGVTRGPLLVSFPFFGMVLAISYELSREVQRAARLARDLETSQRRLALATNSARIAVWEWDIKKDQIWVSKDGRALYGFEGGSPVSFSDFLKTVHEDDRERVDRAVREALGGGGPFAAEYRVVLPDATVRWISAHGRVEPGPKREAALLRGVSLDVTIRKLAELDATLRHRELAHLSRVNVLGELAGSLAHELNQPLAAMLSNAQVGLRALRSGKVDPGEMDAILDDIVGDAKRAGGIVHGMRAMFQKNAPTDLQEVDLNLAVRDIIHLLHGEIALRKAKLEFQSEGESFLTAANRVEIQQVLVNLVLNSLEAITEKSGGGEGVDAGTISIAVTRDAETLVVTVQDDGPGIPDEMMARLFEPFTSTKAGGLGLGLSISRRIVEQYGGSLEAEGKSELGGALFRLTLPRVGGEVGACQ